jgi:hypothetical protein
MALPSVGGGYQYTDGNQSEQTIETQAAPQTATATATLTVAQITGGLLVGRSVYYGGVLHFAYGNFDRRNDDQHENQQHVFAERIINLGTSTGLITVVVGTGITAVGNLVVAITGSAAGVGGAAQFLFRKTGTAAYTVYRVA